MTNHSYDGLAQQWAAAIAPYSRYATFDPSSFCKHIAGLSDQFLELLSSESPDYERARSVEEALAKIVRYPEALAKTQQVLLEYITTESSTELTTHACKLLVEMAIGFGQISRERIEMIEDLMCKFVASAGHAMQVPLDHLLKANKLLQEAVCEQGDDKLLQHTLEIESSGSLLENLIDDYFEFVKRRTNKDKVVLELETFDIPSTIQKVVDVSQRVFDKKGNTLTVNCAESIGTMYANERRVRQILLNLVSNAYKFTSQLCRMMGGDISVDSKVGKGTTFTVRIPAHVQSTD